MFSMIKTFRAGPSSCCPTGTPVTMTVPFMRAYTELLVKTCHRRGAHAMGGMAAFIPSRRDAEVNETALAQAAGRTRSARRRDGFDGTWVAHPDSVPRRDGRVRRSPRRAAEPGRPAARGRHGRRGRAPGRPLDAGLRDRGGLRNNVNVGIQYISSWLRGNGAAGIHSLMEDAATAEISRSQVWQWVRHGAKLEDGRAVTRELVRRLEDEELERSGPRSETTSGSTPRAGRRSRAGSSSRWLWPTTSSSS